MVSTQELNRMRWAARRGMLELDLVLEPFVAARYAELNEDERASFAVSCCAKIKNSLGGCYSVSNRQIPSLPTSSKKYSPSRELWIHIHRSDWRNTLLLGFALSLLLSLSQLALRGYPELALAMLPILFAHLVRHTAQPLLDQHILWREGQWRLQAHNQPDQAVFVEQLAPGLSWVIPLRVTRLGFCDGPGEVSHAFVFADSMSLESWRRLRVRLALSRAE